MLKTYGTAYVATAIIFLAIDSVWLTIMAGKMYRPILGDLLLENFNVTAAVAFYLIYVAAIVVFAIQPALQTGQWTTALIYGAFFGFAAYATYGLTNLATLKAWTSTLALADLAWGTFVTGVSATLAFLVTRWFVPSP